MCQLSLLTYYSKNKLKLHWKGNMKLGTLSVLTLKKGVQFG
jgi:hypothetical protein